MRLIRKLGDWFDLRLQLATPIRETMEHPVPRETASWVYVFGSAALTCFMLQLVTGISARADLCALRGRSVEQPADPQSWHCSRLVHSSLARLGLEFHGRDCAHPHGAGLPLRSLQISPRTDVDGRRSSPTRDARHGLYRPGAAIRSGRLLGTGHRGINRQSRSGDRTVDREA